MLTLIRALQYLRDPKLNNRIEHFSQPQSRALKQGQFLPQLEMDSGQLPLPGLFGRHGVLPDYFTDELLAEDPEKPVLRSFFDIFNHRFYQLLFEIWQRYHFFTEDVLHPKCEHAYREAFYLNCLSGALKPLPGDTKKNKEKEAAQPIFDTAVAFQALRWNKISIYRRGVRSASGLQELLKVFFPDLKIKLDCMVPVVREVPSEHRLCLNGRFKLGGEGLLGEQLTDLAGGIRLCILELDYATYLSLLGRKTTHSDKPPLRLALRELVIDYTRGRLECRIHLELRGDQIPAWQLGKPDALENPFLLGQQTWIRDPDACLPVLVNLGSL